MARSIRYHLKSSTSQLALNIGRASEAAKNLKKVVSKFKENIETALPPEDVEETEAAPSLTNYEQTQFNRAMSAWLDRRRPGTMPTPHEFVGIRGRQKGETT